MAERTISFARGAPSADILPPRRCGRLPRARSSPTGSGRSPTAPGAGHPGLCEWIAETARGRARAGHGHQRLDGGGGAALPPPGREGDRVVVEQPTYDRTLLLLQQAGAELVGCAARVRRRRPSAVEAACGEGPLKLAHVIPNFHNPAGCTLSLEKRSAWCELAGRARLHPLRGRPLPADLVRGRRGETMLDMDGADRVHPRVLVLEDGQPRRPGRLPGRARPSRSRPSPSGPTRTTSRRTCWPSRSSWSSAARAALEENLEGRERGAPRAPRRAGRGPPASRSPRPSSSCPRAATSSGST